MAGGSGPVGAVALRAVASVASVRVPAQLVQRTFAQAPRALVNVWKRAHAREERLMKLQQFAVPQKIFPEYLKESQLIKGFCPLVDNAAEGLTDAGSVAGHLEAGVAAGDAAVPPARVLAALVRSAVVRLAQTLVDI